MIKNKKIIANLLSQYRKYNFLENEHPLNPHTYASDDVCRNSNVIYHDANKYRIHSIPHIHQEIFFSNPLSQ